MTTRETINLEAFTPALDQLAQKIDTTASSANEITSAAMALSSGIIAIATMQNSESDPACPWEGSLCNSNLTLYSATHQLVFTMQDNLVKTAVLSGPLGVNWNISRSEKGINVTGTTVDGKVFCDSLIGNDGSVKDNRNLTDNLKELHDEWQRIATQPENSLPPYTPSGNLPDLDLPSADALADVTSADPDPDSSLNSPAPDNNWLGAPPSFADNFSQATPMADQIGNFAKGAAVGLAAAAVAAATATDKGSTSQSVTGQFASITQLVLGNVIGEKITITEFPALVGRTGECQLTLQSNLVSRQHARFFLHNGRLQLEDLRSSNGTKVNDKPITEAVDIIQGDNIKFADVELLVVTGPQPQPLPPENIKTVTFNMAEKLRQQDQASTRPKQPPEPAKPLAAKPSPTPSPPAPPPPVNKSPGPAQEKCVACQKPLTNGARFCPVCGAQQQKQSPAAPPPPPSAQDLLSKAAETARQKMTDKPRTKEKPARDNFKAIDKSAQWSDEETLTADKLATAPGLKGVGICFGLLVIADHIRLLTRFGSEMADSERFTIGLGMGLGITMFTWISGNSPGFFRFLSRMTAMAFVGHQLYRDHLFIQHIAAEPSLLQQQPDNLLPFMALIFALWIIKRAKSSG